MGGEEAVAAEQQVVEVQAAHKCEEATRRSWRQTNYGHPANVWTKCDAVQIGAVAATWPS